MTCTARSFVVAVGVLASLASGLATACTSPADEAEAAPTCAGLIAAADAAVEPADSLRYLDGALSACESYDEYTAEIERYEGLIGFGPERFVALRCQATTDTVAQRSPTCEAANPPATTAAPTAEVVFVGTTLDGRLIELRPSPEHPFVNGVPPQIQHTVEIAVSGGCEGLAAERERWAALADGSPPGDEASVYAQHAQNVSVMLGCGASAATTTPNG